MNSFEKSSLQLSLVLRIGPTRQSACNVFYRWMSNNTRAFSRKRASLAVWKKNWLKHVQTIITSLTLVRNGIKYLQSRMWWTLALSWRRPLYRNQSIDLASKSLDWFLYDNGLRHERVKENIVFVKLSETLFGSDMLASIFSQLCQVSRNWYFWFCSTVNFCNLHSRGFAT